MDDEGRPGTLVPGLAGPSGHTLLGIYLNDHLAGATVGMERGRHLATTCRGTEIGDAMVPIVAEIAEDRRSLLALMRGLEVPVRRYKVYAGRLGERAGRLKSNGALIRRSPLSTLEELELLLIGVQGKSCAWEVLRGLAEHDRRIDAAQLDGLLERARGQLRTLADLRLRQAEMTFRAP